jgi:ribosomal protein L19E
MSPKKMLLERHKEETQLQKQHHAVKPSAGQQQQQQQHGGGAGAGSAHGAKARHAAEQKVQIDPTRATRDKLAMSDEDDD